MTRLRSVPSDPVDRTYLPLDEWRLVETRPHPDLGLTETLFATANGYLGMRGTPSEGRDAEIHGTFLNGFHETWTINHAESAFGFARTYDIVELIDYNHYIACFFGFIDDCLHPGFKLASELGTCNNCGKVQ